MSGNFYNPVEVTIGTGCRIDAIKELEGKKVVAVTSQHGRRRLISDPILGNFFSQQKITWVDTITANPDIDEIQRATEGLGAITQCDYVVGFGGGSAMDAAKVIRALLSLPVTRRNVRDVIEGPSAPSKQGLIPLMLLPTTAGTGGEVTPFATVWDKKRLQKLSLEQIGIWPKCTFVDAELTYTVSQQNTVTTFLDSINQAFESIWNKNANVVSTAFATKSIILGLDAASRVLEDKLDPQTRELLSEASLLSGLAISQTRTGLCHAISYPLTLTFDVPHGLACAFTMLEVLKLNLRSDDGRFTELSQQLYGSDSIHQLQSDVENLLDSFSVRERVRSYIPSIDSLLALQGEMSTPGRVENNLSGDYLLSEILANSWGTQ